MSWLDPGAGILGAVLQGKPNLPAFQRINPQAEQQTAVTGNISELPQLEKLASGVNTFNQQQLDQMLAAAIPGFQGLKSKVSSTISDELAGKLPSDVIGNVQDLAAAKAIGGGYGGSGMHSNLVARDLGLTSLQLTQQGLTSAQSWMTAMDNIYKQGQFDMSSMFITPQQQFAMDTSERDLQFQHDWAGNVLDWQSSLGYIVGGEMIKDSDAIAQMASSIIGKVGGMALGGAV